MHEPTTLIVGCGDLGTEIGLRLIERGHRVVGWRRAVPAGTSPIQFQAVDVLAPVTLGIARVEYVVCALAPRRDGSDTYARTYVEGARNTLQALDAAGVVPRRALLISSTSVYGDMSGSISEETPIAEASGRAAVQLETETLFGSHFATIATTATVLRCGGIYGPGRGRLLEQVRAGSAVIPQHSTKTSRIHRDDAAGAAVHLLTMPDEPKSLYLGVDDEPAELGDVLRFVADQLGAPTPPIGDVQRRRGGNRECSNARLTATGFRFRYPDFRAGYAQEIGSPRDRHP